ncbi:MULTISPECIES: MazG family protein [unclassified Rothia (in: high G+C Gram-positive bacteria)]|uniref:MazG family protein n=1 Tax=unclassified Rothia (in: high G+C Gram-positive bacteria) TaxID=2689056 RepID=UPI00195D26DC|nr:MULTISPECIES: MazG family protein [unclassified Rothia (in: high G+C Gram-positive bacteria)]MBM7051456.1 MazG family protein [Rothia sp. ZJ1223]QRZ61246.1 MazG family protein [Rothia sp. ZJ932]
MSDSHSAGAAFERLVDIMDTLRSPGGCPWDAEQTHESLVRYLIEEAYEVVEAIEAPEGVNTDLLREELGDVLLQVVFHSRVAAERSAELGGFDIIAVINHLCDKLERRHPHVFDESVSSDIRDVNARWDELKKAEKPERTGVFDGIPPHLPALAYTEKALSKSSKASIDLPGFAQRHTQQTPETDALTTAQTQWAARAFELVIEARELGIDPEQALRVFTRASMVFAENNESACGGKTEKAGA